MGLDSYPTRGESGIYNAEGDTRVPVSIRDDMDWDEDTKLNWVSESDEDFVRVHGTQKDNTSD